MKRPRRAVDVRVEYHGSLYLFRALSHSARIWLNYNVSHDALSFGGALAVEPRYAPDLLRGMREDGLVVQ